MKKLRRIPALGAAVAIGGLILVTSPAPSASALGYNAWLCGQDNQWAGQSTSRLASTKNLGTCGNASARYYYQAYPGSPTYYSSWAIASGTATKSAPSSTTVQGGNHKVQSCGLLDTCGPRST